MNVTYETLQLYKYKIVSKFTEEYVHNHHKQYVLYLNFENNIF